MLYYENKLKRAGCDLVIGVDEAGRGPLAGPVVAAAVTLGSRRFKNRIDDSKKLTAQARDKAYLEIIENSVFGIGIVNEQVIDRLNILESSRIAMEEAVAALLCKLKIRGKKKIHVLVDGNMSFSFGHPYTSIIRGDSRSQTIASASIIAKVTRDRIMSLYDKVFPQYQFNRHKGYPTKIHRALLKKFGPSLIHRRTFDGVC